MPHKSPLQMIVKFNYLSKYTHRFCATRRHRRFNSFEAHKRCNFLSAHILLSLFPYGGWNIVEKLSEHRFFVCFFFLSARSRRSSGLCFFSFDNFPIGPVGEIIRPKIMTTK